MLPPLMTHTTVEPAAGVTLPDSRAARPAAPDGSAASLHRWISTPSASTISPSVTRTISSTKRWTCAKVCSPAKGGARPSAMVSTLSRWAGAPCSRLRLIASAPSGSTPTTRTEGCWSLTARGDAGDEAAPADGNHHQAGARDLPEELQPHRPLAGHDRQVIERVDQGEIPLLLQGQAGLEQAARGLDDLTAVTPGRLDLGWHGGRR